MTDKQVWLITGAGRGMGIDIARAALAAGHAVVGTARNAGSVTDALGEHNDLLAVNLDVTDPARHRRRGTGAALDNIETTERPYREGDPAHALQQAASMTTPAPKG